jgi:hypothetical protein
VIHTTEQQTTNARHRTLRTVGVRWLKIGTLLCCMLLLLSGCLLVSGEQSASDPHPTGGNLSTSFVSAEGDELRTLATGAGPTVVNVILIVSVQQGVLRLEVLDPKDSVVLAIDAQPDESVTKSGNVPTDDQGNLRYRVVARGARNGSFQLLYEPSG